MRCLVGGSLGLEAGFLLRVLGVVLVGLGRVGLGGGGMLLRLLLGGGLCP